MAHLSGNQKLSLFLLFIIISLYHAAKSQLREVLDDMAAKSKVKLNYELPDEVVEDYTYEMGRLKFKVTKNLYPSDRFFFSQKLASYLLGANQG